MLVSAAILAHPSGLGRAGPFPLHPRRIGLRTLPSLALALPSLAFALGCPLDFSSLLCLLDFAPPPVLVSSTLPLASSS